MKKLTAFWALFTIIILFALCARGEIIASGSCGDNGENVTWTLDDQGKLVIQGTGKMENYRWSNQWSDVVEWDYSNGRKLPSPPYPRSSITSIEIQDGVTSIGSGSFWNCSNLTSVNIPDSLTNIGPAAFHRCTSLTHISIPDSVIDIGRNAFCNCDKLISVRIPNNITYLIYALFYGCESLTNISIPEGVSRIDSYAFTGCKSLTSVSIPEGVSRIDSYAFTGCKSLTSVSIPEGVTEIGTSAFFGCSSLTSINVYYCNSYARNWAQQNGYSSAVVFQHREIVSIPAAQATCTQIGLTEGSRCSGCGEVILNQDIVPMIDHTPQAQNDAVAAACTSTGLTASVRCSVCGALLEAQNTIAALGHDYQMKEIAGNKGYAYICSRCGEIRTDQTDAYIGKWQAVRGIRMTDGRVLSDAMLDAASMISIEPDGTCWQIEADGTAKQIPWSINAGTLYLDGKATPLDENNRLVVYADQTYQYYYERMSGQSLSDAARRFVGAWTAGHIYQSDPRNITPRSQIGDLAQFKVYIHEDGSLVINSAGAASGGSWWYNGGVFYLNGQANAILLNACGQLQYDLGNNTYLVMLREDLRGLISGESRLTLPASSKVISVGAFENIQAYQVVLPEGITEIQSRAFADCNMLSRVVIPNTVRIIAADAFQGCSDCVLVCPNNPYIIQFAIDCKIPYYVP